MMMNQSIFNKEVEEHNKKRKENINNGIRCSEVMQQ